MRVFLAGGTGAIGCRLIPILIAHGHSVAATTRSPAKVADLRRLGADGVVLDGLDAVAVGEAVARAEPDVIIHQMTALSGTPDMKHFDRWFAATNRLRTDGTRFLLSAAKASGVQQFVAQSFTGWANGRNSTALATEDEPLDTQPVASQRETLAAIETLESLVTSAPLNGAVLRYGGFYGPGASEEMVRLVRKRMLPVIGNGAGVTSWVHVDDAASATELAVEKSVRGIFNIVDDDPAPVAEWLPHMAQCVGAKPPLHVPAWMGRLLAGEAAVRMMTEARGTSNAKARRELAWTPRFPSWRDGFRHGLNDRLQDTVQRGKAA
jgi:nucleoside-diphosphate-sugar epimerase